MIALHAAVPILRIFDKRRAREFYITGSAVPSISNIASTTSHRSTSSRDVVVLRLSEHKAGMVLYWPTRGMMKSVFGQ